MKPTTVTFREICDTVCAAIREAKGVLTEPCWFYCGPEKEYWSAFDHANELQRLLEQCKTYFQSKETRRLFAALYSDPIPTVAGVTRPSYHLLACKLASKAYPGDLRAELPDDFWKRQQQALRQKLTFDAEWLIAMVQDESVRAERRHGSPDVPLAAKAAKVKQQSGKAVRRFQAALESREWAAGRWPNLVDDLDALHSRLKDEGGGPAYEDKGIAFPRTKSTWKRYLRAADRLKLRHSSHGHQSVEDRRLPARRPKHRPEA